MDTQTIHSLAAAQASGTPLTAQIGLVPHPHTPFEYIIDWVTVSPVHHAVLAINETQCVSAEPGGVRIREISEYPDAYWSAYELTALERETIVAYGRSVIGRPYGWFADIAIGIAKLTKLDTPLWIQRYISSQKRTECAQLCDAAYNVAGRHIFRGIVPAAVFPGMFVPIFQKAGWMP
jgi:hypothetical protein